MRSLRIFALAFPVAIAMGACGGSINLGQSSGSSGSGGAGGSTTTMIGADGGTTSTSTTGTTTTTSTSSGVPQGCSVTFEAQDGGALGCYSGILPTCITFDPAIMVLKMCVTWTGSPMQFVGRMWVGGGPQQQQDATELGNNQFCVGFYMGPYASHMPCSQVVNLEMVDGATNDAVAGTQVTMTAHCQLTGC